MALTAVRHALPLMALMALTLSGCTAMLLGDGSARASNPPPSDSVLTVRVRNLLATDERVDAGGIEVTTRQGVVFLDGRVPSASHSERAEELAGQVQGVGSVRNNLRVPGET